MKRVHAKTVPALAVVVVAADTVVTAVETAANAVAGANTAANPGYFPGAGFIRIPRFLLYSPRHRSAAFIRNYSVDMSFSRG